MDDLTTCPLGVTLAAQLRANKDELTGRWLERIAARVAIDPNRVFPTDDLLDHVPMLIEGVAAYVENPADEISADIPVVAKARELGDLRHAQGFDAYEIMKEHELLGGVIYSFLIQTVDDIDEPCTRGELLACAHRVFRAIQIIQQATTTHFLALYDRQMREREDRLRAFNRMVSHELKNRVGAILGAHALLEETWIDEGHRHRFLGMVGDNAHGIQALLENLVVLSRTDDDIRQHRNILLPQAAAEVVRQLRAFARARDVTVRVGTLPEIEVPAAAVELCLTNYISNAIKYSDPAKPDRWVEVSGEMRCDEDGASREIVVEVRDNGLGVPAEARSRLFDRFFRAHEAAVPGVEGTGLGLSIVRETVDALGGRAWGDFDSERDGSCFAFSLPARRAGEPR
ncbi:MAG: sensor histidine kinase [Gemmatimonadota bacterium]|nr:sensor histidine kinase [Gemmatimonadota bacterium]